MIVICLEGCHGCGKTAVTDRMEEQGFTVFDEAFLDMPDYTISPQSLLMETTWVCAWFARILERAKAIQEADEEAVRTGETSRQRRAPVFIADRSPYSAVCYGNKGHLLEPVIREQIEEVRKSAGIEIYTVHLAVDQDVLWSRIMDRLRREPGRKKYNEDRKEHMLKILRFYETFSWDFIVDNTGAGEAALEGVTESILSKVEAASPHFRSITKGKRRSVVKKLAESDEGDDAIELVRGQQQQQQEQQQPLGEDSSILSRVSRGISLSGESDAGSDAMSEIRLTAPSTASSSTSTVSCLSASSSVSTAARTSSVGAASDSNNAGGTGTSTSTSSAPMPQSAHKNLLGDFNASSASMDITVELDDEGFETVDFGASSGLSSTSSRTTTDSAEYKTFEKTSSSTSSSSSRTPVWGERKQHELVGGGGDEGELEEADLKMGGLTVDGLEGALSDSLRAAVLRPSFP